jgi:tRNA dimethylallyltransferase
VLAIVGATATGKSALAMSVARRLGDIEIVSVDSMQVYRSMDIGTAKPSLADRAEVKHHMIDVAEPTEDFTVVRFRRGYEAALASIASEGHRPLLVGGTGLYLRAVIDRLEPPGEWPAIRAELDRAPDIEALHARLAELDPLAASRMVPTNRRRVVRALEVCLGSGRPFSSFGPGLTSYGPTAITQIGLHLDRAVLTERVRVRFEAQMEAGFLDEVAALAARPERLSRTAAQALGYRELLAHLRGELSLDEAVELAITRTRRFAVRQERWFRRDPRIHWINVSSDAGNPVEAVLARLGDSTRCT